jgi:CBS domain-containing protein
MKVQDVMTRTVQFCLPNTDLALAARLLWEHDCGVLPVVDNNLKVIGVITDRDICVAAGTRPQAMANLKVGEVLSGKLYTCRPDDDIKGVLEIMKKAQVRRLPVTEGDGLLHGILSISDVALCASKPTNAVQPVITYEDIVETYNAICEPRAVAAVETGQARFAVG